MKNNKKLMQNIVYNGIYQVFVLLMPIITIPYVTRIFTADDLGVNSYTLSIVQVFVALSFFGLNHYGGREIAFATNTKNRNNTFWEIWFLQIVTTVISYTLFLFIVPTIAEEYTNFLYIQGFLILLNMLEVSWFFIGIEEFKNVVLRNTTVKILMTTLIFLVIKENDQLWLYMTLNVLGVLVGNVTLMISLRKKILKPSINWINLKKHLKGSLIFLIPQLSFLAYGTLDKVILGTLSDIDQVAFYSQSKQIVSIATGLVTSATTVLLPRMASLKSKGYHEEFDQLFAQGLRYTLLLSFYIVAGIIAVSPSFVHWFFGPSFVTIVPMMQVTAIIGVFIPFNMMLGNVLLLPMKKEKIVVKAAVYAAIFSIIMNVSLNALFGAWGAIITICLVEGLSMCYRLYHSRKLYDFKQEQSHFIQILISFASSIVVVFIINKFLPTTFSATIISGSVVTIIFFGMLILMKNNVLLGIIRTLTKGRK